MWVFKFKKFKVQKHETERNGEQSCENLRPKLKDRSAIVEEDNIKVDLQKFGEGGGDWMELAQDRDRWRTLVSSVKKLRVL
jgi:hypothetical protein